MNSVLLLGRITKDIEIREYAGKTVSDIVLAVRKEYKNQNGLYETEFYRVTLWEGLAKSTKEYCQKGHSVLIRGRLVTNRYDIDNKSVSAIEIIAEKVVFLNSFTKASESEQSE